MFREIRYQTGEINEIIDEMKKGKIPSLDVDDCDDMDKFISELSKKNILLLTDIPFDINARDRIKEPEFEYRVAFSDESQQTDGNSLNKIMFIDFFFEAEPEETYDSILGD